MLASSTSLGLQSLLLKIFSSLYFSLLVIASLGLSLVLLWWRRPTPGMVREISYRATILLLILRFLIPMMAITSEGFYKLFLEPEYLESTSHLKQTKETIGKINEQSQVTEQGGQASTWYENLMRSYESTLDSLNIDKRVNVLMQLVENVTDHTINLIVVFTMQTILFPLLFLWLALQLIKNIIRMGGHR
jgi:hypothetical protein